MIGRGAVLSDKGKRSMYDAGFLDLLEEDEVRALIPERISQIFSSSLSFDSATPVFAFHTLEYFDIPADVVPFACKVVPSVLDIW